MTTLIRIVLVDGSIRAEDPKSPEPNDILEQRMYLLKMLSTGCAVQVAIAFMLGEKACTCMQLMYVYITYDIVLY